MTTVTIPKQEYERLRKTDARFGALLGYLAHILDVREARKEIKAKKTISQDKLFKKLGL